MNYILIALASIIGILVVALRLQGGKLHETQIKLLLAVTGSNQAKYDAAVAAAKVQLRASLADYYKAGGKK